ncbi:MAG: type I restriction enzyme S subunit [Oleispira sp.]|jgi:type I restriction enzyme S subunit
MTVKKTQQNLNTTLENTEQVLGGLENSLGNNEKVNLLATAEDREANDGLPEGWCETTLGKFTDYGKTKKVERKDVSDDLWLLELEDVEKGSSKIIQRLSVSERAFKSTKNKFEKGSVLYGKLRPYLNKIVMAPEDGVCTTEIIPINVEPFGSNKYLFYWLKSGEFLGYVNKVSYGVNMPRLGTKDGLAAPLILPPLAEQTVIAQTLDTLLAQVDNIKTRLDAIPKILKTFRQSVLAAAVSGKLTEEWRGESVGYSSASLNGGSWGDLPNNWQVKAYKEVVDSRLGKMLDKAKNSGIPTKYLGNINVRWFSIDLEKTQEILVSEDEISELSLKIGDVLICEGGEPGRCAIWKQEQSEAIVFQKALHRARVSSDLIPEWLLYNLKNDADNLFLEQFFTGTTIKHLTGKALAKYLLRLPPVKEQTQIVRRVEELFAFADKIEQQVKNAQGRVNNLTQSILAKAFRGELTAQWRAENPDLISGDSPENGSAELLLAKIKAEREALKQKAKPKNKTALKKSVNKK